MIKNDDIHNKKWFLVYCKSSQDSRAEENLSNQKFEVYRPKTLKINKKTGLRTKKFESLFPRYIFILVDPNVQSISPVASTFGVSHFVKFGMEYAIAPHQLIQSIQTYEHQLTQNQTDFEFNQGDPVIINGNGFESIKAIFSTRCGQERAMVLLQILGRESPLTVPLNLLSKQQ